MKVAHVIGSLISGGAQVMLAQLVESSTDAACEHQVHVMVDGGVVQERLVARGIVVHSLGTRRGLVTWPGIGRLAGQLRATRPDVVQGWMEPANLLAGLAARRAGRPPVVWGVHNATTEAAQVPRSLRLYRRLGAWSARRLARGVVCCSEAGRRLYQSLGCPAELLTVIPNGFDLERFYPDPVARVSLRSELGVPAETLLVGLMARLNPQKDHRTFLRAAGLVHQQRPEVRFVLAGRGMSPEQPELRAWLAEAAVTDAVHLLGERQDVPRLAAALDLGVLSSVGEAFGLALGEIMACGVPCVGTDVGGVRMLLGPDGKVVPPRSPEALAQAMLEVLALPAAERQQLGRAARSHIAEHFALADVAARYVALWREVSGTRSP